MTDQDHGGRAAYRKGLMELELAWGEFETGLVGYLAAMRDEDDHLLIELGSGCSAAGCRPYAQFASYAGGDMLRAEISGDSHLLPHYRLGAAAAAELIEHGWSGNDDSADEERNWHIERRVTDDVHKVAVQVVRVLRHGFGIAHPHLLTRRAWGPAAEHVDLLGLEGTADVPTDLVDTVPAAVALEPADRDELVVMVGCLLESKYGGVDIDEDGDFVLEHMGQPVWVCVRNDQPAVEIMARVAHDVHSRRATAVELGLLNRDNAWTRWTLRDRMVWQTLTVPADPFAPRHLDQLLDVFLQAMSATRDDLALRIGAKVA